MERKYKNGFEIVNTKNLKIIGQVFIKIVIYRKAIKRKKDTCVRYECDVYFQEDFPMLITLEETTLNEIIEELNK